MTEGPAQNQPLRHRHPDREATKGLKAQVTDVASSTSITGAPGFKAGYWTWSTGGGGTNGLSMIVFDSEESARAAGDRISAIAADALDDVTLDGVEVREVVASA